MKKILATMLFLLLLTPISNAINTESKLSNEVRICEALTQKYQEKIDELQSKIDKKEKEISEKVIISRPRGNSQSYIQNLRIEGNKYINELKKEIEVNKKLKEAKEKNCSDAKQKLEDYLETVRINKILSNTGENPCNEGFFPKNGKCVTEREICTDVVNGYYNWESKKCVCNENYRWKLGRCRIIADNALNQELLKKLAEEKANNEEVTNDEIITETTENNDAISLQFDNKFQRIDKYMVRIRKIENINKALFQFIVLDRETRNKVTSYEIKITSDVNEVANKTSSKGILLFRLGDNKNIQIEVSMLDEEENLIESVSFEVE